MISEILAQIDQAGGIARPNRFLVWITPPRVQSQSSSSSIIDYFEELGLTVQNATQRLKFMCCRAELPGKSFGTSDIRTYGSSFRIPNIDTYPDVTLHFIVGTDMFEKDFFDAWSYTIQDPESADFNFIDEYATVVDIYQLDEMGNANYGIRLFQAWPLTIGSLTLDYNERNTFHVLPVTFTFRKTENLKLNSNTPLNITPSGRNPGDFKLTINK